jgi:hypothetical protein
MIVNHVRYPSQLCVSYRGYLTRIVSVAATVCRDNINNYRYNNYNIYDLIVICSRDEAHGHNSFLIDSTLPSCTIAKFWPLKNLIVLWYSSSVCGTSKS